MWGGAVRGKGVEFPSQSSAASRLFFSRGRAGTASSTVWRLKEWWAGTEGEEGDRGGSPFSRRVGREPGVKNFQHFVICFCSPFATTSLNAPAVFFLLFPPRRFLFRSRRNAADENQAVLGDKILR